MSGSKKKTNAPEQAVNTLGIDVESPAEEDEYEAPLSLAEKVINYATLALAMLLLGGSFVIWWVMTRHLLLNPSNLADAKEMSAVLICSAAVPLIVTIVQALLKKPGDIERWLINMCVSGAASALLVVLYQVCVRKVIFTFSDLPTLLCCSVSGCALPAAIYLGIRSLIPVVKPFFARSEPYTRESWEQVRADVLSLTDFDF